MEISDRILFMKYALPCAGTLVRRGTVTQEYVDSLISIVARGAEPYDGAERMFKVANAVCNDLAEKMGKSSIDSEVIRKYFLLEHARVVDDRYKLMGDFDPVACNTYSGKVVSLDFGKAVVKTRLGSNTYRIDFANDIREEDEVIVHWDFVVERMPEGFPLPIPH